jgi:hypothetical protein
VPILTFLVIAVVAALAHRIGISTEERADAISRVLDGRAMLAVVFAATFAVIWYSWGMLDPMPTVHDEMAYVLQSQILATGHWTLPSPPMPAFWEQPQVLVEPALAAKYFPGHALVLTLGTLVGWTALMPLVLQSAAGVLLFLIVRRVKHGALALLTWVIWLTSPMVLHFGPSYFSEATTVVCWLGGWYALLEWRTAGRPAWLALLAFLTAWGFITRPLTGVAYAIPIAAVVLHDVVVGRRWRELVLPAAVAAAVLAIIPIWSAFTTGDWRLTPLLLYTRQYMPYDLPGFGLISTPPTQEVSEQLQHLNILYSRWHPGHVPANLPHTLAIRTERLTESIWGWSRRMLMVFAALGLLTLDGVAAFALAGSLGLLLLYLYFATPPAWTLYYYESVPVYAYLTAAGLAWAISLLGRPRGAAPAPVFAWSSRRWGTVLVGTALAISVPGLIATHRIRREHHRIRLVYREFELARQRISAPRAVLFVHYAPAHDPNVSYVKNVLDPSTEPVWVVFDRGPEENAKLLALAPDREAFIFDEDRNATFRYDPRLVKMSAR